jgi:hypothetical protein
MNLDSPTDSPIVSVQLLLTSTRRIPLPESQSAVQDAIGQTAAATVRVINESDVGMSYTRFHVGKVPYHIGTSIEPYIRRFGTAKPGEQIKWTIEEEVPPEDPVLCDAWMMHKAWMYVDSLRFVDPDDGVDHFVNVMRLAGRFVDERCVLIWLLGPREQPKCVTLPAAENVAALRAGRWPGL